MEAHDKSLMLGVYKMIHDIHDKDYVTPLKTLKDHKQPKSPSQNNAETNKIVWWVGFIISGLMLVLYGLGVYFTYIDDEKGFNKTFNNLDRLEKIEGQQRREALAAEQRNQMTAGVTVTPVRRNLRD